MRIFSEMTRGCLACLCGVIAGSSIGCVTPWNTQLPTPYAMHPKIENRRNEQFDPFARGDLGPDTLSRPREYADPRSHARQTQDAALRQSPIMPGAAHPSQVPPGYGFPPPQQYPQSVPF